MLSYICIQIRTIQLLIFTEPRTSRDQADMLPIKLSWLGLGRKGVSFESKLHMVICECPLCTNSVINHRMRDPGMTQVLKKGGAY